ncbi:non-ribosomal peptide synthetase, partial [Arenibaculum sp.]|uniref:non-ribosomal peptide synthetase n=1 Tax=Arenibaculum sp. TaxID=2865862 RepID=UPI002E119B6A|nr:AMP-binding protein [Arenibaculum sp.]
EARHRRQLAYWKEKLEGAPFLLPPITDFPRPRQQSYRGRQVRFDLSPDLTAKLKRFSRDEGVTPFMALLSAFEILLCRYCNADDLLIGSTVANRKTRDAERVLGMFVNTIVVRADTGGDPTFRQLLGRVRDTLADAYEHDEVPFELIVRALQPSRSTSHNPIFQVGFSFHSSTVPALEGPGFTLSLFEAYSNRTSKFDLEVVAIPRGAETGGGDAISLAWNYSTDLFAPETMDRMRSNYVSLLENCLEAPGRRIGELSLVSPAERRLVAEEWNRIEAYPVERCIHELFEAQAKLNPDATAVTFEGRSLSYGALNARANRLARHLRTLGVGPDRLVAVCAERSPEMVVALLAVLKAGGAYLPLDPAYPAERLAFMLADAAPVAVVTDGSLGSLAVPVPVVELGAEASWTGLPDTDLNRGALTPRNLAYVIYTSGSTGTPKGVMVEHANVVRLFAATAADFAFGRDDVWTLFHSFAFDFSVWEIWGALLHGGRLVVVPQPTARSPQEFYRLLCEQGVTVLNQTPSAFRALVVAQVDEGGADESGAHGLRWVVFGGEALEPAMLAPWYRDARNRATRLVNMYGITETTVHVTFREMEAADAERAGSSPIGRPLGDLRVYLLDGSGEPVPV